VALSICHLVDVFGAGKRRFGETGALLLGLDLGNFLLGLDIIHYLNFNT
jgi:hypothetical protein